MKPLIIAGFVIGLWLTVRLFVAYYPKDWWPRKPKESKPKSDESDKDKDKSKTPNKDREKLYGTIAGYVFWMGIAILGLLWAIEYLRDVSYVQRVRASQEVRIVNPLGTRHTDILVGTNEWVAFDTYGCWADITPLDGKYVLIKTDKHPEPRLYGPHNPDETIPDGRIVYFLSTNNPSGFVIVRVTPK